jgi:hypothetical protein
MMTFKKFFVSLVASAVFASLTGASMAHPGHFEPPKKSQKPGGKHAINAEKTGTLALSHDRKVSIGLSALSSNPVILP